MNLAALILGVALSAIGIVGYITTQRSSWTALIPTFFGVVFVGLGLAGGANSLPSVLASALSVFGLAATGGGFIKFLRGFRTAAVASKAAMSAGCLAYLAVAVTRHLAA